MHNNRLSRCRRLIENSFRILANTWRILLRRIDLQPDKARLVTLTCCLLHNILRHNREPPTGAALEPIDDTETFGDLPAAGIHGTNTSMGIRDKFKRYVNNVAVSYN